MISLAQPFIVAIGFVRIAFTIELNPCVGIIRGIRISPGSGIDRPLGGALGI